MMNTQNIFSVLNQAVLDVQNILTSFAFQDQVLGDFTIAFGDNYNQSSALSFINQWQTGDFSSFPEIEVRDSAEINGANGAYSVDTNKIYISQEFLLANADNVSEIVDLVLEEYGHFVDDQINPVDAFGDEGYIFSRLVQGQSFTNEQLQELKIENDQAVITIDGQEIAIEQNDIRTERLDDGDNPFRAKNFAENRRWEILAERGNDEIWGATKNDTIYGWYGNDTLLGEEGDDRLLGEHGNDELHGWYGNDYLHGGDGNDTLYAQQDNDTLIGGWGLNYLHGGSGSDTVDYRFVGGDKLRIFLNRSGEWGGKTHSGYSEYDKVSFFYRLDNLTSIENVWGGQKDDTIWGNNDNNDLYGEQGNDKLYGEEGDDRLFGWHGDDELHAWHGNDLLKGEYGNDLLLGQDGDDTLIGGYGIDILNGGNGNDTADFSGMTSQRIDLNQGKAWYNNLNTSPKDEIVGLEDELVSIEPIWDLFLQVLA